MLQSDVQKTKEKASAIIDTQSGLQKRIAQQAITRTEEYQKNSSEQYRSTLTGLISTDGALENEIPYMIKMDAWHTKKSFFITEKDEEEFSREFVIRMEKVRPFRNAIVHKLENKFSVHNEQKIIAEEFINWLKVYEERFSKLKE